MPKRANFFIYRDAISVKLKNKRVTVMDDPKGVLVEFLTCDGSDDKRTLHHVLRGKVVQTRIKLSSEAMEALIAAYEELTKKERYSRK